MLQKINDLLQFFFRFISAGYILKGNLILIVVVASGITFAKTHDPAATTALLHQHKPDADHQQHRE